jgi:hypothetical protein
MASFPESSDYTSDDDEYQGDLAMSEQEQGGLEDEVPPSGSATRPALPKLEFSMASDTGKEAAPLSQQVGDNNGESRSRLDKDSGVPSLGLGSVTGRRGTSLTGPRKAPPPPLNVPSLKPISSFPIPSDPSNEVSSQSPVIQTSIRTPFMDNAIWLRKTVRIILFAALSSHFFRRSTCGA